jgi:4-amino-4-deoxy-L-arabinose transferase-like glycosyltransferase
MSQRRKILARGAFRVLALALFITLAVWLQAKWIMECRLPTQVDTTTYTQNSIEYYQSVFLHARERPARLIFFDNVYPHFEYIPTAFFYHFLGASVTVSRLSLLPWYALLMLSMYGCGKRLGGEGSGWLLMLGAAASPAYLIFSRFFFLEVPLTATAALSLYLLLASDWLRSRALSILFGLSMGLMMMFKGSGIIFVGGVAAVAVFQYVLPSARPWPWKALILGLLAASPLIAGAILHAPAVIALQSTPEDRLLGLYEAFGLAMIAVVFAGTLLRRLAGNPTLERAWNLLNVVAMALLVFFPWYAKNCASIGKKVDLQSTLAPHDYRTLIQNVIDMENLLYMGKFMLLIGIVIYAMRWETAKKYFPLVAGSAVSFVALSLTHQMDPRYMLPFLPIVLAVGLMWTAEAAHVRFLRPLRFSAIPLTAVLLLQMTGWLIVDSHPGAVRWLRPITIFSQESNEWGKGLYLQGYRIPTTWPPVREPFHLDDAIDAVVKAAEGKGKPRVLVYSAFSGPFLVQDRNFPLEALLMGADMELEQTNDVAKSLREGNYDFCITAGKGSFIERADASLEEIARYPMPWGNELRVCKVRR